MSPARTTPPRANILRKSISLEGMLLISLSGVDATLRASSERNAASTPPSAVHRHAGVGPTTVRILRAEAIELEYKQATSARCGTVARGVLRRCRGRDPRRGGQLGGAHWCRMSSGRLKGGIA
jgi:hypothetical protein